METYLLRQLSAQPITAEAFQPFGQVIYATEDGKPFSATDAQLNFQDGVTRFYIMRLQHQSCKFHKITRHLGCTQCLGSLEGKEWLIGVAPPSETALPAWEEITVFRVPGNCFIKLNVGTWHAGPYFESATVDFYNLELTDTNLTDHHTCNLIEKFGVEFEIL